jgi:hypothetical protein
MNSLAYILSEIGQKEGMHFLAQIHCFFFFSQFCHSTSNRPPKDVFSTFSAPSKDAEDTSLKNIAIKLFRYKVNLLRVKNPQLLPRPPTLKNVFLAPLEFLHR